MHKFEKIISEKSDDELRRMASSADQYQDVFLQLLKNELVKRGIEVSSPSFQERLLRIKKIESIEENRVKDLKRLPPSILWASNFVYLSAVLYLLSFMYASINGFVIEASITFLITLINIGMITFIAWVIKEGRDIRKLLIYVVVTSAISFLIVGLISYGNGDKTRFGLSLMNFVFPMISLILLYTDDSSDWYKNEGVNM